MLDEIREETNSDDDGHYQGIPHQLPTAEQYDTEGVVPREFLIDKENLVLEENPTARKTFGDDPESNAFPDLITKPWQPIHCADDFNQVIGFGEAPNAMLQTDPHIK